MATAAAASMFRGAAAGALRRGPVAGISAAPFPLLRGGLHLHGAAPSPLPPPAAAAAAMSTAASGRRPCNSTTKLISVPEQENRKQDALAKAEAAKAELLRQLAREDAAGGRSKKMAKERRARTAAELAGLLRRQVEADAAAAPAEDKDRRLMLALLARSARAEKEVERQTSRAGRAERELEELRSQEVKANELMERAANVWTEAKRVFGNLACTVVIVVALGYSVAKNM